MRREALPIHWALEKYVVKSAINRTSQAWLSDRAKEQFPRGIGRHRTNRIYTVADLERCRLDRRLRPAVCAIGLQT